MPADPTAEGQGILNQPVVKPFPEPTSEQHARTGRDADTATDSLATPDMEEPPPAEDENQPGFIGERNRPAS